MWAFVDCIADRSVTLIRAQYDAVSFGLGFGIATLNFPEIRRTAVALALCSAIAILLPVVLVSISPVQTITGEIAGRTPADLV